MVVASEVLRASCLSILCAHMVTCHTTWADKGKPTIYLKGCRRPFMLSHYESCLMEFCPNGGTNHDSLKVAAHERFHEIPTVLVHSRVHGGSNYGSRQVAAREMLNKMPPVLVHSRVNGWSKYGSRLFHYSKALRLLRWS